MFAKVVSSNGEIALLQGEISREVILENQLQYFEINTSAPFYICLNDDEDKILIRYDTSFKLDRFPIYKFKVEKYFTELDFIFNYYGYY